VVDEVDASDGRKTHVVRLGTVTPELLIDYLSRAAYWLRYDRRSKEWVPDNPTLLVAKIILSRAGEWRLPKILGVITHQTLRPDGSLLTEAGYDPATRLLLTALPPMPQVPENPKRVDAEVALQLLLDLLSEFPFADNVSRAVALSALITPVVRPALGAVPMHAFSSPEQGTGKSYLVDLCAAIVSGRACPVIGASTVDTAELEKRLAAAAIAATPILSVDNVNGVLTSDLLCQLIERPLVEVRVLGQSRNVTIPNHGTIFATGNNLAISGDLVRRTLLCRMDACTEEPEHRAFCKDPFGAILADRGRYVAAALTIVRAYIAAGMPGRCKPLPSFTKWSDYVRSALVWLGCADPVDSIRTIRSEDPRRNELVAVVEAWAATCPNEPLTAAQLVQRAAASPELTEALLTVAGRHGSIDARALGYWLRSQRDRVVNGWRIEFGPHTKSGRQWVLVPVNG
jgi:putative DNA primase/helicase